jgi:hypothetical protein
MGSELGGSEPAALLTLPGGLLVVGARGRLGTLREPAPCPSVSHTHSINLQPWSLLTYGLS